MKKVLGLSSVLLFGIVIGLVGCKDGPEHIPLFQSQIDIWQKRIDAVEKEYGLPPSDPKKAELERLKTVNAELVKEKQFDQARIAELESDLVTLEEDWFKKLTVEQQIQWRMHRDLVRAGAKTEIRQNIEQLFRTQSKPGENSPASAPNQPPKNSQP